MAQQLNRPGFVSISYTTLGIIGAFLLSGIGGALSIGGLQTHVSIDTARGDLFEIREREHLVEISRMKARQEMNEQRIKTIEDHDIKTREIEGAILEKLASVLGKIGSK